MLTGGSVVELQQKLALVITQLDRYCTLNIAPLPEGALPAMAVRSHEARVAFAHEAPLAAA